MEAASGEGSRVRIRRRVVLLLCAAVAMPLGAQGTGAAPGRPGREISLPPNEVKDTFFAYVLGIIKSGVEVDIDNPAMRAILTEFKSALNLPFDLVARVTQHAAPGTGTRIIGLDFLTDVVIPIPFSLLFYHPGSITSDRTLTFAVNRSTYADPGSPGAPAAVFDLVLTGGRVLVDVDDWLEWLFSASIEDTWIRHIVFFTWRGDWIGELEGTGRRTGRQLRAFFDFTKNKILFPEPSELAGIGHMLVPDAQGR
jgi:hypothetical protein